MYTEPSTVVEGTCDLIYARRVSTGLDITNIHVITPTAGPVIIMRIGLNITNIHVVTPTFFILHHEYTNPPWPLQASPHKSL